MTSGDAPPKAAPKKRGFPLRLFIWIIKTIAYMTFLLVAVLLLLGAVEWLSKTALSKTYMGKAYRDNLSKARMDYTRPVTHYDYDFNPGVCLEYNVAKGNRYEYANNAGFREPRDIPMDKPADEFRIFLTGGSTAYGMGAGGEATVPMDYYALEYRETISHMLEMLLNNSDPLPGKRIRVYNAAVWGYAYQHDLIRYMAKLRQYKPDMVISLDGANEIPLVSRLRDDWNYFKEGQYNPILQQMFSYSQPGLASYLTLWLKNNTYFMSYVWAGRDLFVELNNQMGRPAAPNDPSGPAVDPSSPPKTGPGQSLEELSRKVDKNIATVVRTVEDYSSVMKNDGVPHIIALQPWFYLSKKKLHEKEKILPNIQGHKEYFGVPSDKIYKVLVDKIVDSASRNSYFLVDFSDYFDDVTEWAFTDWCHLTAEANYLIAKELANLVKEGFFRQPLREGDKVDNKDSYFWDVAASGKVVYALPPESPDMRVENILQGYPSDSLYSAKASKQDDKVELVVDLEKPLDVSRLRIVWADEASVPEEWVLETSLDRETWQTFVKATNKQTDDYARWPGFECYAPEPSKARYLRYRPVNPNDKSMRLRLLSMFR